MKVIIEFLIKAFGFMFSVLGDGISSVVDSFSKQKGFNAQFGSESDISSRFNKGFVISKNRKLSRKKSFENLLVCGQVGSGKTSTILVKNLFELKNCSLLINDPSKELFNLSSGYLSQFFDVKTLNFSDALVSSGFNILSRVKKSSDVNRLAHMLVASTLDKGGSSDPFWSLQSKSLLQIFIRLVLHQPEQFRNMANVSTVLQMFSAKPKKVDGWMAKTKDEKLILEYQSLIKTPEKTLQNIVSSAKSALQIFDDDMVAKTTSYDSIDLDNIRKKPTVIFIHTSVADQRYLSTLTGIFFEQVFNHFLHKLPERKDLDVFVILEECSSIYIPLLPLALANLRKHRVGCMLAIQQGHSQLKTLYKEDSTNIIANCVTKLFLHGLAEMSVLHELETLGGKCVYTDEKGTERIKPLISADEIRQLPEGRTLIMHSNKPLIKGRVSAYFKSYKYKKLAEIPPLSLASDIPDEPIALMQ